MALIRSMEPKKPTGAQKKRFFCPNCGFYSREDGYCPVCEIIMSCHPMMERQFLPK
jgi:rubrerythrin